MGLERTVDNHTVSITFYRGMKMTEEDKERYLDQWGTRCLICGQEVQREDMVLMSSVIKVEPRDGGPVTQYYLACPDCIKKGELV